MALSQADMVIPAVILRLAEFATLTACWLAAVNARSAAPTWPGATQSGPLSKVPVLLLPDESAVVVPLPSSKLQSPFRPLMTSPSDGVAVTCVELALSPP